MSSLDLLVFPSGRSVGNCRKDAKRLARLSSIPLNEALDRISAENGLSMPWAKAMRALVTAPVTTSHLAANQMTQADIARVMEREPALTHFGLGIHHRSGNTLAEHVERFKIERESLLQKVDECNKALRWLTHATRRKTINPNRSSYGLKHSVEYYMKSLPAVDNYYVSNGSFICAALHAGFEMVRSREGSPNAHFNISERSPILEWARLKEINAYSLSKEKLQRRADLCDLVGAPAGRSVRW